MTERSVRTGTLNKARSSSDLQFQLLSVVIGGLDVAEATDAPCFISASDQWTEELLRPELEWTSDESLVMTPGSSAEFGDLRVHYYDGEIDEGGSDISFADGQQFIRTSEYELGSFLSGDIPTALEMRSSRDVASFLEDCDALFSDGAIPAWCQHPLFVVAHLDRLVGIPLDADSANINKDLFVDHDGWVRTGPTGEALGHVSSGPFELTEIEVDEAYFGRYVDVSELKKNRSERPWLELVPTVVDAVRATNTDRSDDWCVVGFGTTVPIDASSVTAPVDRDVAFGLDAEGGFAFRRGGRMFRLGRDAAAALGAYNLTSDRQCSIEAAVHTGCVGREDAASAFENLIAKATELGLLVPGGPR